MPPKSHPKNVKKTTASRESRPKAETGAIPELPLLRFSENLTENNFQVFRDALHLYAMREYKDLGRIIDTLEYYVPPDVVIPAEVLTPETDPGGFKAHAIRAQVTERFKYITAMESNRSSLYSVILGQLSTESTARIKQSTEWTSIEESRDPLRLWKLVMETHTAGVAGEGRRDYKNVRDAYALLKQGATETLADYHLRFKRVLNQFTTLRKPQPEETEQATDFISGLDPTRYATFVADLENSTGAFGILNYPTTLAAAYVMATKYKVPKRQTHSHGAGATVFLSQADEEKPKGKGKKDKQPKSDDKRPNAKQPSKNNKGERTGGSKKTCPMCSEEGHWAQDCPWMAECKEAISKKKQNGNKNHVVNVTSHSTDNDMDSVIFAVDACDDLILVSALSRLGRYDVLLDNQASTHVFKEKSLLSNIRPADFTLRVTGIAGESITSDLVGDHDIFGEVCYCPRAKANVLCFAMVNDAFEVEFNKKDDAFYVHTGSERLCFGRRDNIYPCNMKPFVHTHCLATTVEENEAGYTQRELKGARTAKDLASQLGYPNIRDLLEVINTGSIINLPVTQRDVLRAYNIYGPDLASIKGKTTSKKQVRADMDTIVKHIRMDQSLCTDIMFVSGEPYLISISMPLGLIMTSDLKGRRTAGAVRDALWNQLALYTAEGFKVTTIIADGEGAISKLTELIQQRGIRVNTSGAGQHVHPIERRIRVIKERCRGIINTLPFTLGKDLIKWLVYYVVSRLNLIPSSTSVNRISAREAFTGRKTDYKRDVRVAFGEYCQVSLPDDDKSKNSMKTRTEGAIALLPTGNLQGSVYFLSLSTGKTIKRDSWIQLPMPQNVINQLNSMSMDIGSIGSDITVSASENVVSADEQAIAPHIPHSAEKLHDGTHTYEQLQQEMNNETDSPNLDDDVAHNAESDTVGETVSESDSHVPAVDDPTAPDTPPDAPSDVNSVANSPIEDENDAIVDDLSRWSDNTDENRVQIHDDTPGVVPAPQPPPTVLQESRYNLRPRRSKVEHARRVQERKDYCSLHISVKKGLKKFGKHALRAIVEEIQQMVDKKVFHGVNIKSLTSKQLKKVIRSSIFLKEKYLSCGTFDKLKGRLVAGGHMQDRSMFDDNSSPTVATASVFMLAALAAREHRYVITADIGGAYLNASMGEHETLMKLDPLLAAILTQLDATYEKFVDERGEIIVKLDKALYGCVQSAKLWYEHLRASLERIDFSINPNDVCVFNKGEGDEQCTICIHVDDLMITCKLLDTIDDVLEKLIEEYKDVQITRGVKHSYLGMTFDFGIVGKVSITMEGYIADLLRYYNVTKHASTPATTHLFDISKSPDLQDDQRMEFHSAVAKLLYLAKRVRPEILTAISFLSSRVSCATVEDMSKLNRVLAYLNVEPNLGLVLEAHQQLEIHAYVDASYGVHADGKSHTGGVISIGSGAAFVKSSKQKLVSKSSTEAELIALSDMTSNIIWTREFLQHQGYYMNAASVYQDNTSTIALAEKGRSTSERTRHVNIRYFFIKDRISSGDIKITYLPTNEMTADILTKPLQGELFRKLRSKLLHCLQLRSETFN